MLLLGCLAPHHAMGALQEGSAAHHSAAVSCKHQAEAGTVRWTQQMVTAPQSATCQATFIVPLHTQDSAVCVCVCALCCVVLQAASAQKQPSYLGRKDPPTSRTTTTATSSSSDQPSVPLKGVLELGGGSLQVTFLPEAPLPSAEASPLALPNLGSGRLYSRSFDGLGLQVRHPSGAVCFCNEILCIECF